MYSPPTPVMHVTEEQYSGYARLAKPLFSNRSFAAMAAMAASHPDLDLLRLTPPHLVQPLIEMLLDWQKHMHIDAQSALDRLHGIYGVCGRCQKYRIQEIGGITLLSGEEFRLNGPHICEECRQAIES